MIETLDLLGKGLCIFLAAMLILLTGVAVAYLILNLGNKADAVAVVRCKDCKHFISFKGERAKVNTDKIGWCDINDDSVRADDYCSYGERRSE